MGPQGAQGDPGEKGEQGDAGPPGPAGTEPDLPGENVADGGSGALNALTSGTFNTAMGARALLYLTTGTANTAFGHDSLIYNNGSQNSAFGMQALRSNLGASNTAIGQNALGGGEEGNSHGDNNTAVGVAALFHNDGGNNNTALGVNAGDAHVDGDNNIYVGNTGVASESNIIRLGQPGTQTDTFLTGNITLDRTGSRVIAVQTEPDDNTDARALTVLAGSASPSGIPFQARLGGDLILQAGNGFNASIPYAHGGNVQIRSGANWINGVTNGGQIILQTGSANNAFIERMRITDAGSVGIGTSSPSATLDVNGGIRCVGAVDTSSDDRFKMNVAPLADALEKVRRLRGVSYDWKRAEFPNKGFNDRRQLGLIAQEVREVLPEVVSEDNEGYLAIGYSALIPVLAEGVKELDSKYETTLKAKDEELAELRRQLAEQKSATAEQQKQITALLKSVKEQAAQIQKVNDKVELTQPAPRTVEAR